MLTQADSAATGNKSFTVSLSDPIGGVSLGTTQAQCTIVEPDANAATRLGDGQGRQTDNQSATSATVSISGPTTAVTAGTSANLTVTLSAASSSIVSAYYQTVDGTASAGVNYCSAGGWATISAGQTSTTIPVSTRDDGLYEANDEYFSVQLVATSGASLAAPSATAVWVHNTEPQPTMHISGLATAMQAGTSANLTVTLSGASGSNASAYYCTGDGTASAFVNYCSASGWATISAGQTSTTIPVIAMDDVGRAEIFNGEKQ